MIHLDSREIEEIKISIKICEIFKKYEIVLTEEYIISFYTYINRNNKTYHQHIVHNAAFTQVMPNSNKI